MGRLTEYLAKRQGRKRADGTDWLPKVAAERLAQCDPPPSYLAAANAHWAASRERQTPTTNGWRRTRCGPLQSGYTETGLTNRQRTAGRAVKTLLACKRCYETGDRTTFDRLAPKLDRLYAVLQDDGPAEFGPMLRARMFPRWCHE